MRQSIVLSFGCIGLLIGAGVYQHVSLMWYALIVSSILAACALVLPRVFFAVFLLCIGIGVGWWRADMISGRVEHIETTQSIEITGTIITHQQRIDTQQVVIIDNISGQKILVVSALYPQLGLGNAVTLYGKLQKPETFSYHDAFGYTRSFAYDAWLRMRGIGSVVYYPRGIEQQQPPWYNWRRALQYMREWCREQLFGALPVAEGSLMNGILFGEQYVIDTEIAADFQKSGLTHLVALSGFNITIIAIALLWVAPRLYIARLPATIATFVLIGLFTIFTGAQASIVRAAIMGSITVYAYLIGRPHAALPALLVSAAGMVLVKPLIMQYDVGFQLSLAATAGLLLWYQFFEKIYTWVPTWYGLRETVAATTTATIATLPIIIGTFGIVSIVSLPANILIVPIVSLTMAGGALVLVFSWLPQQLLALFVVLTWALLAYMIAIARLIAGIPHAVVGIPPLPGFVTLCIYGGMLLATLFVYRREIQKLWTYL